MYFRNDKKMVELNKVYKERNRLQERLAEIQNELHAQKLINMDKIGEIRKLKEKSGTIENDFKLLKVNFNEEIANSIRAAEKPLKSKIKGLQYDIKISQEKLRFSNFLLSNPFIVRQQSDFSKNSNDEVLQVMDDLSRMILSKNNDPNFLSSEKKALIKSLFGDFATNCYKQEISLLKGEIASLQRSRVDEMRASLRYIESLLKCEEFRANPDLLAERGELLSHINLNRDSYRKEELKGSSGVPEFSIFSSEDGDEGRGKRNSPKTLFKPELDFSAFIAPQQEKEPFIDFD